MYNFLNFVHNMLYYNVGIAFILNLSFFFLFNKHTILLFLLYQNYLRKKIVKFFLKKNQSKWQKEGKKLKKKKKKERYKHGVIINIHNQEGEKAKEYEKLRNPIQAVLF